MEIKVIEGIPEQGLGEGFKIITLIVESGSALCAIRYVNFQIYKIINFEVFPRKLFQLCSVQRTESKIKPQKLNCFKNILES